MINFKHGPMAYDKTHCVYIYFILIQFYWGGGSKILLFRHKTKAGARKQLKHYLHHQQKWASEINIWYSTVLLQEEPNCENCAEGCTVSAHEVLLPEVCNSFLLSLFVGSDFTDGGSTAELAGGQEVLDTEQKIDKTALPRRCLAWYIARAHNGYQTTGWSSGPVREKLPRRPSRIHTCEKD